MFGLYRIMPTRIRNETKIELVKAKFLRFDGSEACGDHAAVLCSFGRLAVPACRDLKSISGCRSVRVYRHYEARFYNEAELNRLQIMGTTVVCLKIELLIGTSLLLSIVAHIGMLTAGLEET